jgi:small nuclear ribonucleoprotein (snRNP)-like protein
MNTEELNEYLNKPVVVDTATPLVYIGTLSEIGESFITLNDVDVHDVGEGASSKAVYALKAKKSGVEKNRTCVKVRIAVVMSISLLEDIIEY